MKQKLTIGFLAFAVVSATVLGGGVDTVAEVTSSQVVSLARQISAGKIASTAVTESLGSASQGAALIAAIRDIQANGGLKTEADWAALSKAATKIDKNLLINKLVAAADQKTAVTADSVDSVMGIAKVSALPKNRQGSEASTKMTADELIKSVACTSKLCQEGKDAVLDDKSKLGAANRAFVAGLLKQALYKFPATCSAGAQAVCSSGGAQLVFKWSKYFLASGEPAIKFMRKLLDSFKGETPNYVGAGERVLNGGDTAMELGPDAMPAQVKMCFETGEPGMDPGFQNNYKNN